MTFHHLAQQPNKLCLHLTRHELTSSILPTNTGQLLIILQEKGQILVGYVHFQVGPQLALQFCRFLSPRESILIDLGLDRLSRVCHVNGCVSGRCAHLATLPLERWEELGVDQCGLLEPHTGSHIPCHTEVRILINGTRDQAWQVHHTTEWDWESTWEGWGSLDGGEGLSPDIVRVSEAEDASGLVVGHQLLDLENSGVHVGYVVQVREHEGLVGIEATGNDVLGILIR